MSKISEQKALEVYPKDKLTAVEAVNRTKRFGYIQGYDQSMKDFLEKAKKWIEYEWSNSSVANLMFNSFKNYIENESEN